MHVLKIDRIISKPLADNINLTFTADNFLGPATGGTGGWTPTPFSTPLNHLVIRWDSNGINNNIAQSIPLISGLSR